MKILDTQEGKGSAETAHPVMREIGRLAAEAAYDHLAGKPVTKNIIVPVKLITKEKLPEGSHWDRPPRPARSRPPPFGRRP
ncbi:MAG: hypothetical protein K9M97_13005 [Akkermansiaceae bacterium]|nr:hypothetical protein [Akkermansiaceae bacterium]